MNFLIEINCRTDTNYEKNSRTRAIISSLKTQHTLSAQFGHLTVDVSFTEALCQFFSGMALAMFYSFGEEIKWMYTGRQLLQILLLLW
jgi:hypothetical protein